MVRSGFRDAPPTRSASLHRMAAATRQSAGLAPAWVAAGRSWLAVSAAVLETAAAPQRCATDDWLGTPGPDAVLDEAADADGASHAPAMLGLRGPVDVPAALEATAAAGVPASLVVPVALRRRAVPVSLAARDLPAAPDLPVALEAFAAVAPVAARWGQQACAGGCRLRVRHQEPDAAAAIRGSVPNPAGPPCRYRSRCPMSARRDRRVGPCL